jgi:pyruvate formate-lyase activating enzyme-like uncharacterized protein
MKEITPWLNESTYIAPLSPACEMCANGSKLVILITGLCPVKCLYCPLSLEKGGKDRIFADEWELDNENDITKLINEAKYIDATGAGVTGGDPLVVWKRTKNYISLLKDTFGENFHIHLYTPGVKNGKHIHDLVSAGLDEIRFHPIPKHWSDMNKSPITQAIKIALETSADVAIEIPCIPRMDQEIFNLVKWANDIGINWINLNELEYSERNADKLNFLNYSVKDDISAAVTGSQESANNVLTMVADKNFEIGVHYCSSSFKDGIQLKNRIKRRAKNIVKAHEVISDDGTLLKGVIYTKNMSLQELYESIKHEFNIGDKHILLNGKKKRIELGLWILEKISSELKERGLECYMIEEYPTVDELEVERIPLPLEQQ